MSRTLRPAPVGAVYLVDHAIEHLRMARALLAKAECPATLKKVRSTLKSAEGARRHVQRRERATK